MSSKRPTATQDTGLTEAQKEKRKLKKQQSRADKANAGLLSKNRPGFRSTILTTSMGLAGQQGQTLG